MSGYERRRQIFMLCACAASLFISGFAFGISVATIWIAHS